MIAATGLEIGSWVAAILVAVGVVIGWVTGALRRAFEWLGARIRRRPRTPRTAVKVEPLSQSSFWSQAPVQPASAINYVTLEMNCVATNLGPLYDLQIVNVDFEGLPGERRLAVVSAFDDVAADAVFNPTLEPHQPRQLKCIVAVERDPLPDRTIVQGRMVLRDQYGHEHKSPRNGSIPDVRFMYPGFGPSAEAVDHGSDG